MTSRSKVALLSFFFAVCMTGAVLTAYVQMEADANVKPAELYAVVERQLGELRGGDFSHAYEYASSGIQRQYTLRQFTDMVQMNFASLTNATRAEYGPVETNGRHATMQIYLVGENGEIMPCVYLLVREGDGWRIDGARLMEPWPASMRMDDTLL